ncbi:MAG TPA: PadR family transcriptional regulator [Rothia sp.]|nr:PadR family transcriptional regulator [Rothia sp. (in: high G+C Gram-positive bacteria)]
MLRALLPTGILTCLETGHLHDYGIAARLEELGFDRLKGGSLYPALSRLEEAGAVTARWVEGSGVPARREYSITPKGRARLAQERASLSSLTLALGQPAHLAEGVQQ